MACLLCFCIANLTGGAAGVLLYRPSEKEDIVDKISAFQIQRLQVSGFKCFDRPVVFQFGEIANILGSNHVGKSSIADAIAFAVTGSTYWGESRIDRMYSEGNPDIEIQMDFADQNGKPHQLIRQRKNDRMTVTLDTYRVTQARLNELFGDRDTFLSIFNPLYLIEVLQDEGKSLLEYNLPPVSHEQVLSGLSDFDRSLLKDVQLLSPELYTARLREEIRELDGSITAWEGQSALLAKQRRECSEALAMLKASRSAAGKRVAALTDAKLSGLDQKALEREKTELHLRYDELLADKPVPPDTAEMDRRISQAIAALERLKTGAYVSKFQPEAAKIAAEKSDRSHVVL